MAEEYKITPIPDRMTCQRMAKKWQLTSQMKKEEIERLSVENVTLRKKLRVWRIFACSLILLLLYISLI